MILNKLIVVEGKDDKSILSRIVKDPIFVLNGYSGVTKKNLERLYNLSKKYEILLLLDSDFAGKKMRKIITDYGIKVENLYIPRLESTKKGDIGIENVKEEVLRKYLEKYKSKEIKVEDFKEYTLEDLIDNDLVTTKTSSFRREKLGDILNIGYQNAKQLLKSLNSYKITRNEFKEAIKKVDEFDKVGIIFGKFYPMHLGHLKFIKKASRKVRELLVFLCVEDLRDRNLFKNSTLPKDLTDNERLEILQEALKDVKNVKIYILDEKNINYYPNGWYDWSIRVLEKLEEIGKKIDVVFTNEKQDIDNYIKYFNCDVKYFDLNRNCVTISATEIRTNYENNKKYLTKFAINILEGNNG